MAKIISVKTLREALGYDDSPQVNDCLSKALDSATLYIESIIKTSLTLNTTNEDIYDADEYREKTSRGGRGSLYLLNGFVDEATVVVSLATSLYDWSDEVIVDTTKVFTKGVKGVVYLDLTELNIGHTSYLGGQPYIKVAYTSGFSKDASGVFKDTPDWMDESAKFIARELYRVDDDEVDLDGDLGAMRILENHIRKYGMTVDPLT